MPEDLTWLDAAAFVAFLVIWFGYGASFDGRFRRPNSINAKMIAIREAWMMRLFERDNRIASSAGVLGSAERVHSATVNLSVLLGGGSPALPLRSAGSRAMGKRRKRCLSTR